jgi:hypothetical protein
MTIKTVQTGECPVCSERHKLRKDGTMWHHTDKRRSTNLPFSPRCTGVYQAPKGDTVQAADR